MSQHPVMRPLGRLLFTSVMALMGCAAMCAQQTPAAPDAAAPPPARKLSASEAYFESMKSNHAPALTKGTAAPPAAAAATPAPVAATSAATPAAVPVPAVETAAPAASSSTAILPPAATAPAAVAEGSPAATAAVQPVVRASVAEPGGADTVPPIESQKHGRFHREKAPKLVPVDIQRGVLTVDGWTGKADLNYHIPDIQFLYVWVPGTGIVIISHDMFPGAKFQPDAFDENSLTVKAEDHQIQLTSDRHLLNSKKPEGAYVALDREGTAKGAFPQFGFGRGAHGPYEWPASLADDKSNPNAPPLPASIRPNVQTVKLCHTNPDGSRSDCHDVVVPMETGKSKG